MKRSNHTLTAIRTGVRIVALSAFGAALLSQSSCVKEDRTDCPRTRFLYVVVDTEDWNAVDESTVNGATVFLFNADSTLITSVEVSGADIAANVPIQLTYDDDNIPWVAAWGNLDARETVSQYAPGDMAKDLFVAMARGADGYTSDSSPMFFGTEQLTEEDTQYVTIAPKTGRIMITVRGADPSASYYFELATPYGSYDFTGIPIRDDDAVLRLPTVFLDDNLILQMPYHLFHYPDPAEEADVLTVRLFEDAQPAPRMIVETWYDRNGDPIVIPRARTVNVLIDLIADIRVTVIITGWDQIYTQWSEW